MEDQKTDLQPARPVKDFARVVQLLLKGLRYASFAIIGVTVVVMVREVTSAFQFLEEIHPALAWTFLAAVFAALYWFVFRQVLRFWRLPPALKQPRLPERPRAGTRDVLKRLDFAVRYVEGLARNPRLAAQGAAVETTIARGKDLHDELAALPDSEIAKAVTALDAYEKGSIEPLLAPLDEEANKIIRKEALAVGIGTAISMNGTVDAFLVLWRNANLVTRVATIYFGRPGIRGSLMILRDVAGAMFLATQMQGISQSMANLCGGWLGRAGSFLVGPAGDGAFNAFVTVRIGYVAKARCRAFRPWNADTLPEILRRTMKEVASQGTAVVKEVVTTVVKGGLIKIPTEMARKASDLFSGLFGRGQPETP